jgi:hypothetical protein
VPDVNVGEQFAGDEEIFVPNSPVEYETTQPTTTPATVEPTAPTVTITQPTVEPTQPVATVPDVNVGEQFAGDEEIFVPNGTVSYIPNAPIVSDGEWDQVFSYEPVQTATAPKIK